MAENTQNKITPAQRQAVWDEFKKSGYSPSSEGEIDYWAAKPIGQLYGELQKRKTAEPKGKMTNDQLYKLYDEFGLASRLKSQADYDWAKSNLPNDVEALKKVLKVEQTKDLAAKKNAGMNQQTNNQSSGNQPIINNQKTDPIVNPPTQKNSAGTSGALNSPTGHLVKFTSDPNGPNQEGDTSTLWYVDTTDKVMRPIMSLQAFNDIFNNDPESIAAAKKAINTLDPKTVQAGGQYSNFVLLGADYGILPGGKYQKLDFTPKNIQQRYGQPASQLQVQAGADLDKLINFWENSDSGLDKDYLEKIKNDPTTIAGLIGAVAYGNYTYGDVWKELKRKALAQADDVTAQNSKVIDNNLSKNKYSATAAGKAADSAYKLPDTVAGMDSTMLDQPITNMPDDFYKTIFAGTEFDPSSPEFMAKAAKVKSDLHDLLLNQLNADTVNAKNFADQKYAEWKTATEKDLGISLSNDAYTAWNQLGALQNNASRLGIADSGIANEAQDKYLESVRRVDQQNRDSVNVAEADKARTNAMSSASTDEILAMNKEDAAKGLPRAEWRSVKWGLAPQEEMTLAKFISNFRSTYPDSKLTDDQIKDEQYSQYYDINGNKYSSLYQQKEDARQKDMYGGAVSYRAAAQGSYSDAQNASALKTTQLEYDKKYNDKFGPDTKENPDPGKDPATFNKDNFVQGTDVKKSLGTDTSSVQKALAGRIKIPDVKTMQTYDPSQYSKEADGGVYLKSGIIPVTAKKITTGTNTANQVKIKGAAEAAKNMSSTPPKTSTVITPVKNSTVFSSTKTPPAPIVNTPIAKDPLAGLTYIADPKTLNNYTNITKDPAGSKKLYGTLKK